MAKREKLELMKLVLVIWKDAQSMRSGWKSLKKLREQKPIIVKSVGWLADDQADHIKLCASHVEDNDVDGDVVIVRGMIVRIIPLDEPTYSEPG